MNTLTGTKLNNLHIACSPLLTAYDFRASSFYDGHMSLSVMTEKIINDIAFENKLKKLFEEKTKKKGNN